MREELLQIVRPKMWDALATYDRLSHRQKTEIVYACIKRLENSETDPADAERLVFWVYEDNYYHDFHLAWKVGRSVAAAAPPQNTGKEMVPNGD